MKIKLPNIIKKNLPEKTHIQSDIETESETLAKLVDDTDSQVQKTFTHLTQDDLDNIDDAEVSGQINSLRRAIVNIAKTLIKLSSITDEISSRYKDYNKSKRVKIPLLAAPANTVIDMAEMRTNHFARGMNWYKIVLLFLIGSFSGVIVETLWVMLRYGILQSRVGLVYGPFNGLYGLGVIVLSYSLYNFRNHGRWVSFLGGAFAGSVLEYMCSFFQEMLIGSRSWDYSDMPFNLNGRICLLYSIFWGILGVIWMKDLYPRTAELILKLPDKFGRIFTWCVFVFFLLNVTVSGMAVYRWSERVVNHSEPKNIWLIIDKRFPDERMQCLFPSMQFKQFPNQTSSADD